MANEVIVAEIDDGQRLDRWIKKYYPHITFGQAQKIVRTGQMRVNGKRVKNDTRLEKANLFASRHKWATLRRHRCRKK